MLRYPTGTKLAGVVLVQRFYSHNTFIGHSLSRNIEALKELCGDTTLKNLIIMTHHRDDDEPEAGQMLKRDISPGGCFHPVIEQGAQVYHCTGTSKPDSGALRIILGGRPVIPKVQQEPISEGSGPEGIAPATEPSKEIQLAERHDNDAKKLEENTQEVMNKEVEELRRELEEEKRRAREEADTFKKQIAEMQSKEEIARKEFLRKLEEQERGAREEADGLRNRNAEMQSKLEEDRHTSGMQGLCYTFEFSSRSFPPRLKAFLVGPCAHLSLQRVYPSTDLRPNSPIVSTTHFTGKSMNDVCKTSRRMTSSGSLTI